MKAGAALSAGRREWIGLGVLMLPTILIGLATTVLHLAVARLSVDVSPCSSIAPPPFPTRQLPL
jgi:MFS transporter, DHA2 family, multidrug resistance protein